MLPTSSASFQPMSLFQKVNCTSCDDCPYFTTNHIAILQGKSLLPKSEELQCKIKLNS